VVIILQSYIMMSNPSEYNPFNKLNMADGGSILLSILYIFHRSSLAKSLAG